MEDRHNRRHSTFTRVKGFGLAHHNDFAANSLGTQMFTAMSDVVAKLDSHAADEASARGTAKEGTSTRSVAREALKEALEAISRTAHAIAEDTPGIDDKFRVPRGRNDSLLLNAARAAAADAGPLSAQFISHEMPPGFIADLNTRILQLEAAIDHHTSGVGNSVAAGVGIDETVDEGMVILRKLNAIVRNRYEDDPATLAEWTSVSHTERAPKHKAATTQPSPTPPPAP